VFNAIRIQTDGRELEEQAALCIQRVWLVRQEGLEQGLSGVDQRRYMDARLRPTWEGFKACRKRVEMRRNVIEMGVDTMVEGLINNVTRSVNKQGNVKEQCKDIEARQLAMEIHQEQVENELRRVNGCLLALRGFLAKL